MSAIEQPTPAIFTVTVVDQYDIVDTPLFPTPNESITEDKLFGDIHVDEDEWTICIQDTGCKKD